MSEGQRGSSTHFAPLSQLRYKCANVASPLVGEMSVKPTEGFLTIENPLQPNRSHPYFFPANSITAFTSFTSS
jgi:hypothetical protein